MVGWGWEKCDCVRDGLVNQVALCRQCESCKIDLWFGKLPLLWVECDLLVSTSLEKLANVINVLGGVRVIDDDIIYDVVVPTESCEGLIHPAIVVF